MCQHLKKMTLCTCAAKVEVVHNKKSRRNKNKVFPDNKLTWTLYQYLGAYDSGMDGMLMEPSYRITAELTFEYILAELNARNCFDFEYNPNEGDNLIFYGPQGFMSFIFGNNRWAYEHIRIDKA
jgi:hypothetical protein